MKQRGLVYISILACLLASRALFAQDLPSVDRAKEITVGSFPNGVTYYYVDNKTYRGHADVALIQKTNTDFIGSRHNLVDLPHFEKQEPYHFLSSHGVGYSEKGFIYHSAVATVYSFKDVPVFEKAVADSTILLIHDLMNEYPYEQAVVISGDFDQGRFKSVMEALSLAVTPRKKAPAPVLRQIEQTDFITCEFESNNTVGLGTISLSYSTARASGDKQNTPVPFVMETFAKEAGLVIYERARLIFREKGIPIIAQPLRYHRDRGTGGSSEVYTFEIGTEVERLDEAASILYDIVSDINHNGVTQAEYNYARSVILGEFSKEAGAALISNSDYVDRCVNAFLFGSNLASTSAKYDFFSKRGIPEDRELILFNNYVAAFLNDNRNLTICYSLPSTSDMDRKGLVSAFGKDWEDDTDGRRVTLELDNRVIEAIMDRGKIKDKVKIIGESTEPITSGKMWTFNNGIKVVYKKMPTGGTFNYAFMLKGGYASVENLAPGESAFVGDMLSVCNIAGFRGDEFHSALHAKGITMTETASLSDLRICGQAPSTRLPLLLSSILAMATERTVNMESFEYYKDVAWLQAQMSACTQEGVNAVMDSLLCPDYYYPTNKRITAIGDDLPLRTEAYFAQRFSAFNDGMIVLLGDLEENYVKTTLCKYLSIFPVSKYYSIRPKVAYSLLSGTSTYTVPTNEASVGDRTKTVNMLMSTISPMTLQKYLAFKVARTALEKELVRQLAEYGVYAKVSDDLMLFPVEKMSIVINCGQCESEGLPEGVEPADPVVALAALRKAVNKVLESPVSAAELKNCKEALLKEMSSQLARPDYMVTAVLTRYSEGKNLAVGYEKYINQITAADVQSVLSELNAGGRVEYVLY